MLLWSSQQEVLTGRLRRSADLCAGVDAVAVFHGNVEVPKPENVVLAEEETVCTMLFCHLVIPFYVGFLYIYSIKHDECGVLEL